jgi:RHS repeat-associated protein
VKAVHKDQSNNTNACTSTEYEDADVEFLYTAGQQRLCKIVKPHKPGGAGIADQDEWIYYWYVYDAGGNPMGVYRQSFDDLGGNNYKVHIDLQEHGVYGSGRTGIRHADDESDYYQDFSSAIASGKFTTVLSYTGSTGFYNKTHYSRTIGYKQYEVANHLGNVLVTISDKRLMYSSAGSPTEVEWYVADVQSYTDYYVFGAPQTGRAGGSYRYGFNGKENDDEIKDVAGSSQDYGMRMYDPRVGRFFSADPLLSYYPQLTPYQFSHNCPVTAVDIDGMEGQPANGSLPEGWFFSNGKLYDQNENEVKIKRQKREKREVHAASTNQTGATNSQTATSIEKAEPISPNSASLTPRKGNTEVVAGTYQPPTDPGDFAYTPSPGYLAYDPNDRRMLANQWWNDPAWRRARSEYNEKMLAYRRFVALERLPKPKFLPPYSGLPRGGGLQPMGFFDDPIVMLCGGIFFRMNALNTGIRTIPYRGFAVEEGLVGGTTGTTGFRYMSAAELEAVQSTAYLRGGLAGETYFTKDVYKTAALAKRRLSLGTEPAFRVEFEILNDPVLLRNGTKVIPGNGMSGGGAEFMTTDLVRVRIINWQPIK